LPSGALRLDVRHPHPGRQGRQHGVPGLRPGAHRHGAVQDSRLRPEQVARASSQQALALESRPLSHSTVSVLAGLDPASYPRSVLHAESCVWVEKNCYIDVWIEMLHALGLEPRAVLPCVAAIDFEGDQWTFFKPPHAELWDLYGIDVQELNVWRPLIEHALEHLGGGKFISTEADAFWLPDTSGT